MKVGKFEVRKIKLIKSFINNLYILKVFYSTTSLLQELIVTFNAFAFFTFFKYLPTLF